MGSNHGCMKILWREPNGIGSPKWQISTNEAANNNRENWHWLNAHTSHPQPKNLTNCSHPWQKSQIPHDPGLVLSTLSKRHPPTISEQWQHQIRFTNCHEPTRHHAPSPHWSSAHAPTEYGPISYGKIDIKDKYWRMCVEEKAEWNFAYVLLPNHPTDPMKLVVPAAL